MCPWLVCALSVPLWFGCSSPDGDGGNPSTGGAETGGAESGGSPSGGAATGGSAMGGSPTGGAAVGGSITGGAPTGGVGTGGATGGAGTGGIPTGGAATGGAETGGAGAETGGGGAETGGTETGGVGTGGTPTGGTETGGAETGGTATGGAETGGAQTTGSPGCGSTDPLQSGTVTVDIDGTPRTYVLDVPNSYDANNLYRLIFVWHPLGGNANQVVSGDYNGLKSLANDSAIFVAADGLYGSNHEAQGNGWWNEGGGDMKLLQTMLDTFNAGLCIDQERIFSTGFSFGGMMSYTVGWEFDVFRAVAPCSGDMEIVPFNENNTAPLPIMAFHGSGDPIVSIDRGRAARDRYLSRNNCGTETQPVNPSPCVEYQGCDATTIWCEFSGGHEPMSGSPQAIWDFLSQY